MSFDLLLNKLSDEHVQSLKWLPSDGSPKDRGQLHILARPMRVTLEAMSHITLGDPRSEWATCVSLCEKVFHLDRPKEFDDHWRLTPLGVTVRTWLVMSQEQA